jgi:hypothetical protein
MKVMFFKPVDNPNVRQSPGAAATQHKRNFLLQNWPPVIEEFFEPVSLEFTDSPG